jgi:hypothetical protein
MPLPKKTRKRIWQTLLAAGLLLELALIAISLKSMLEGGEEALESWQIIFFCILAVWIYIAYLKQRSLDISRHVVDEKVKTHLLVNHLREGILLLDPSNRVMLINERAAALTGLPGVDILGRDLAAMADDAVVGLLNSGRSGEATGACTPAGKPVHTSLVLLPPDREGDRHKLLYVSAREDLATAAPESAAGDIGPAAAREAVEHLDRLGRELLAGLGNLAPDARVRRARTALDGRLCAFRLLGLALRHHAPDALFPDLAATSDMDLNVLVQDLAAAWRGAFDLAWDLKPAAGPLVARVHAPCIRLALEQVLANAVAGTLGTGRPLTLRLAPLGAHAGVSVLDGGPAPADANLPRLFNVPYHGLADSAENPDSRADASGLFAARRLVEAQGGTLVAAPGAEGGLQVTLMLPGAP